MMKNSSTAKAHAPVQQHRHAPEPTWEIALLFPEQGDWSVEEYLALPGNRLVEFSDGRLEFLPMPTTLHQWILFYLSRALEAFVAEHGLGLVLPAALPVELWPGKVREPDVVFMLREHRNRVHQQFWEGADLVIEVVSDDPKGRRRDLVTKRGEYARAGIPEYWIVDPKRRQITVLRLRGDKYVVHGNFKPGRQARSRLLAGFTVDVDAVFAGP
jgi:Uma2 family endonuclease